MVDAKDLKVPRFCSALTQIEILFNSPSNSWENTEGLEREIGMWLSEARVCCRKGPIVRSFVSKLVCYFLSRFTQKSLSLWMDGWYVCTHTHTDVSQGLRSRWLLTGKISSKKKDFLLFSRSEKRDNVWRDVCPPKIWFLIRKICFWWNWGWITSRKMLKFFKNNVWIAWERQTVLISLNDQ